jgi:hypothetical protein
MQSTIAHDLPPMNALDYSRNAMAPSCFAYATIRKFFAMV